jgi:putative transposase
MPSYAPDANHFQFQHTLAPFLQAEGLPFAEVLTPEDITQAFDAEQVSFGQTSRSFWTPALTLWAFLAQVTGADPSCRQAVAAVVVALALSRDLDDLDTGAYCRARAKLPAKVLQRLALQVGQRLERAAPEDWLWHGRHTVLVDGSTSKLPDTPANQQAFPQPRTQKRGLGFPLIRWVVLVALATAAVQGLAYGPYLGKATGEPALFRQLLEQLRAGDVVVADRYYCSYFLVALLQARGVDVVFRLHQRRHYDFRRGRRLGPSDHVVVWQRPQRPEWMTAEAYAAIPETLTIREFQVQVNEPGYRVRQFVVATTLRDHGEYSAAAIAQLYHKRWQVELDIRSLKTTLQMDRLRCRTPFMMEKEVWAHVLAYNLVRKVTAQSAWQSKVRPRSISFKATLQVIRGGWQKLTETMGEDYVRLAKSLLRALRKQRVGNRPGRCEPRAVKDRGKPHRLLQEPRAEARAKLLKTGRSKTRSSARPSR